MQHEQDEISPLAYATPGASGHPSLAAAIWITVAGLGLIVLGGCFCIGIMISLRVDAFAGSTAAPAAPTVAMTFFISLLYVLAFVCFACGAWVMFLGIRKLLAIGR